MRRMAEIITGLETMKALLEKSENDAETDEWGYMRPSVSERNAFSVGKVTIPLAPIS
jgi:aromatic ring hydroxylase